MSFYKYLFTPKLFKEYTDVASITVSTPSVTISCREITQNVVFTNSRRCTRRWGWKSSE